MYYKGILMIDSQYVKWYSTLLRWLAAGVEKNAKDRHQIIEFNRWLLQTKR